MSVVIPVPKPLIVHDGNAAENWRRFKSAWNNYEIASSYSKKSSEIRVALFLSVVGDQGVDLFETFSWEAENHRNDIGKVLEQFEQYCIPRKNVLFETYRFTCRKQGEGEPVDTFLTSLRKIAEQCEFTDMDRRLRDQLVFGVQDQRVRERLLRESNPQLKDVIGSIRASEIAAIQSQHFAEHRREEANAVQKQEVSKSGMREASTSKDNTTVVKIKCRYCGRMHERKKEACKAFGKTCNKCGKVNHFAVCCESSKSAANQVEVKEEEAKFLTYDLFEVNHDSSYVKRTKTFKAILSGQHKFVTFHIDTGASCNVLPFSEYVNLTQDYAGRRLLPSKIKLRTYGGKEYLSEGSYKLNLECQRRRHTILVHVVKIDAQPLLSLQTCQDLGIVKILDSDEHSVQLVEASPMSGISKGEFLRKYQESFTGLGKLHGTYRIQTDKSVLPVIHAPRKFPVSLRDDLKTHLEQLEINDIIAKVTRPMEWVSSLLVVREPGKFRICLDPRDLNRAICREHYQLPCIEKVTTRLSKAKVFTVLDAKKGFWQVELEDESSYLTTFNTPFGRYRWLRMPFGISSAPEIWQRRMHEFIEGLNGVEVIADDFLVVGCGETIEDACSDHDRNLSNFMKKANQENLKLNSAKLKFKQSEVPFIGHLLTTTGLKPDPRKVEAIKHMKKPENENDVRRFLGMVQYLSKFLPELSAVTTPLRRLTECTSEWNWHTEQEQSFEAIKVMISSAPVLAYFDVAKQVVVQADASNFGLGAVLLQDGKPVHFTSRALTKTEQNYAQIEKEMLAIAHACAKFDHYIYGRHDVVVHTDHKPLEVIFRREMTKSPKRLQRMLLFLQKYQLTVSYKRGAELYIADTLSRANLPKEDSENLWDIMSVKEVELHHQLSQLPVRRQVPNSEKRVEEIREASTSDETIQAVLQYVRTGWPEKKNNLRLAAKPYFNYRDTLTEDAGILVKDQRIVVPNVLRPGVLQKLHIGHLGIEGTLRKAREYVFWPGMNAQIKQYVSQCDICSNYQPTQSRQPLQHHDIPTRPWEVCSADMFQMEGLEFMVVVDHYSNFFEVERMSPVTSQEVIRALKKVFSRYGIPDRFVSDNGPQFSSAEFREFSKQWEFTHITSSPHYPRSNGRAESAVKICKQLMRKSISGSGDLYAALLDYRNTPDGVSGMSPAQKCFGRRLKSLIPAKSELFLPEKCEVSVDRLLLAKKKQAFYYNRGTRELTSLSKGQCVRMQLPGQRTWTRGVIYEVLPDRSYVIEIEGSKYRRNRQAIRLDHHPEENLPSPSALNEPNSVPLRRSRRIRKPIKFYQNT